MCRGSWSGNEPTANTCLCRPLSWSSHERSHVSDTGMSKAGRVSATPDSDARAVRNERRGTIQPPSVRVTDTPRTEDTGGGPAHYPGPAARQSGLQGAQELEEREPLGQRQPREPPACGGGLPAVRRDRLLDRQCPPVMHESGRESQTHERLRPKLGRLRVAEADVGELRTHVVQQQVS